ncbi:hypothetical protein ES708_32646 [subsurface metagenome]
MMLRITPLQGPDRLESFDTQGDALLDLIQPLNGL